VRRGCGGVAVTRHVSTASRQSLSCDAVVLTWLCSAAASSCLSCGRRRSCSGDAACGCIHRTPSRHCCATLLASSCMTSRLRRSS
jgi:hypothetical protein